MSANVPVCHVERVVAGRQALADRVMRTEDQRQQDRGARRWRRFRQEPRPTRPRVGGRARDLAFPPRSPCATSSTSGRLRVVLRWIKAKAPMAHQRRRKHGQCKPDTRPLCGLGLIDTSVVTSQPVFVYETRSENVRLAEGRKESPHFRRGGAGGTSMTRPGMNSNEDRRGPSDNEAVRNGHRLCRRRILSKVLGTRP